MEIVFPKSEYGGLWIEGNENLDGKGLNCVYRIESLGNDELLKKIRDWLIKDGYKARIFKSIEYRFIEE